MAYEWKISEKHLNGKLTDHSLRAFVNYNELVANRRPIPIHLSIIDLKGVFGRLRLKSWKCRNAVISDPRETHWNRTGCSEPVEITPTGSGDGFIFFMFFSRNPCIFRTLYRVCPTYARPMAQQVRRDVRSRRKTETETARRSPDRPESSRLLIARLGN